MRHRERQEVRQHARQECLDGNAQQRAHHGAGRAQGHCLQQINRKGLAHATTQASQQRHRVEFLFDMNVDRAGHADPAEQQRDQPGKA